MSLAAHSALRRTTFSVLLWMSCVFLGRAAASQTPPTLLASFDTNGPIDASDVVVNGSYAYVVTANNVAAGGPELWIFSVANPQAPTLVGTLDLGASATRVRVSGRYAYVTTRSDSEELLVIDCLDKSRPMKIGSSDIPGTGGALSLAIRDLGSGLRTAYVGTTNGATRPEFYAVNLSDPFAPNVVGTLEIGGDVNAIALDGTLAHLATNRSTKEYVVVDIASYLLREAYSYDLPSEATAVDAAAGRIVVATANAAAAPDLFTFELSPTLPALRGSVDLQCSHTAVASYGSSALVAGQDPGKHLQIVDISRPTAPTETARFNAGDKLFAVASSGGTAYLAGANNAKELQIVRAHVPEPDPSPSPPPPATVTRPNIIVIMADDQRWDTVQSMPTVMGLAEKGMVFRNSFVTTSLCSPSRASFLTGQYAGHVGVTTNLAPSGGASAFPDANTVATWLQGAGYRTALIGKYFNQYSLISPHVPPGWDHWSAAVEDLTGALNYFDYSLNEDGLVVHYGSDAADYSTDVLKQKALAFIHANAGQPFFLVFTPLAPHSPATPALRHKGSYASLAPFRPASWQEADVSDKPSHFAALKFRWNDTKISDNDRLRIDQLETLRAVDDAVRQILDAVDASGIADRTLVVYTSDNGMPQGEHWQTAGTKNCAYEECIRVPLVLRFPAVVTAPRVEDRLVLNVDLAPTFAELAGLPIPPSSNGRSLLRMLNGTEANWRTDILLEHWEGADGQIRNAAVRNDRWKYIRTYEGNFEELYDLEADPFEMNSVVKNGANAPILDRMRTRLDDLQSE